MILLAVVFITSDKVGVAYFFLQARGIRLSDIIVKNQLTQEATLRSVGER